MKMERIEGPIWIMSGGGGRSRFLEAIKMSQSQMEPKEVVAILSRAHAHMQEAYLELVKIRGTAGFLATDAAFACGEALGVISRAKALVGRDIDERQNG
jgi:hypothetical protein